MLLNEILSLKFPNASFLEDIVLRDDGQGAYIDKWNLTDPKPTQKDLDKWEVELDLPYRQQQAVSKRQYPSIADQLDMMYKDKINNTNQWVDNITAVKTAHPKPMV